MNIIVVMEKAREKNEKQEMLKTQNELLQGIKEELRKDVQISAQHHPNGLYQKQNYISHFFSFDKKQYFSLLIQSERAHHF